MPPAFHPALINSPEGDPGLFIPMLFQRRAVMMDLGDITALSPRDILKITHIFVTHTHMDHFIGFDHLLRILLGREKQLYLYGPAGFLANLEGKLAGYTWNLVDNYTSCLALNAVEVHEDKLIRRGYASRDRFIAGPTDTLIRQQGAPLHDEPEFLVSCAVLDHGLPVLGFSLEEKFTINIRKDALDKLGLFPGSWLQEFKGALYRGADPDQKIRAPSGVSGTESAWRLGELARELAIITRGQKIAYICDVGYSRANREKIVELVHGADHLFIEAAFLEKEKEHAGQKQHLTARQAGEIAAAAEVRRFTLFHFSPRYAGNSEDFYQEAANAATMTTMPSPELQLPDA
jgi:ribonuclease Z